MIVPVILAVTLVPTCAGSARVLLVQLYSTAVYTSYEYSYIARSPPEARFWRNQLFTVDSFVRALTDDLVPKNGEREQSASHRAVRARGSARFAFGYRARWRDD